MILMSDEYSFEEVEQFNFILNQIHNSPEERLNKNDFRKPNGTKHKDVDSIVSILESFELIETEKDPDIYYLTPEAYELLETGGIHFIRKDKIEKKQKDRQRNLNYSLSSDAEDSNKTRRDPFFSSLVGRMFLLSIFAAIFWFIWSYFERKEERFQEKENIKIEIIHKQHKDSLE